MMPQLNWNENDFLECLECPQVEDYEVKHFYQVTKDGLTLAVSVWQHESLVLLSLRQQESDALVIEFAFCVRRAVRYVHDKRGEYLDGNVVVVPDRFAYQAVGDMFDETVFKPSLTVQLFVVPSRAAWLRALQYKCDTKQKTLLVTRANLFPANWCGAGRV